MTSEPGIIKIVSMGCKELGVVMPSVGTSYVLKD